MTTTRQVEANRQNARRSTGPRTAQGKTRVARNAVVHGLLSRQTLLPDEDPQVLETLAEAIRSACHPEGPQECVLVDLMIRALWRMRRLGRVEAGIFARKHYGILADRARRAAELYESSAADALVETEEEARITDPAAHEQALADVAQSQARRNESLATIGLVFIRGSNGADAFGKLSRYEAAIERSLFRAWHELQRLQLARRGGPVPPPVALDVTVSGVLGETPESTATERAPRG